MKKFFSEFKEFALRGNVMDMAVGVVIGGAFKGLVDSLVGNILTPIIGLVGGADLSAYALTINGVPIQYCAFLSAVLNFFLMAFVIFLLVKSVGKIRALRPAPVIETKVPARLCPYCKTEIDPAATRCPHCTSLLNE